MSLNLLLVRSPTPPLGSMSGAQMTLWSIHTLPFHHHGQKESSSIISLLCALGTGAPVLLACLPGSPQSSRCKRTYSPVTPISHLPLQAGSKGLGENLSSRARGRGSLDSFHSSLTPGFLRKVGGGGRKAASRHASVGNDSPSRTIKRRKVVS